MNHSDDSAAGFRTNKPGVGNSWQRPKDALYLSEALSSQSLVEVRASIFEADNAIELSGPSVRRLRRRGEDIAGAVFGDLQCTRRELGSASASC